MITFRQAFQLSAASFGLVVLLLVAPAAAQAQARDKYATVRRQMVAQFVKAAGVRNPRVLKSLETTLRHEFVSSQHRPRAYYDMALPIGSQQTISSPFIVAYMTEALDPQPTDKVLEIGTGSGYQAAILSPLVDEVYSIEIVPELGAKRRARCDDCITRTSPPRWVTDLRVGGNMRLSTRSS